MTGHRHVVLSCVMSRDSCLDDAGDQHVVLSNAEDRERVDTLRTWATPSSSGPAHRARTAPAYGCDPSVGALKRRSEGRSASHARVVLPASGDIGSHPAFFAEDGTDRLVHCDRRGT